jgi:hypothetical protein
MRIHGIRQGGGGVPFDPSRREFLANAGKALLLLAAATQAFSAAGCNLGRLEPPAWKTVRGRLGAGEREALDAISHEINRRCNSPLASEEVRKAFEGQEMDWERLLMTLVNYRNLLPSTLPRSQGELAKCNARVDDYFTLKKNPELKRRLESLPAKEQPEELLRYIRIREAIKISLEELGKLQGSAGEELLRKMRLG